MKILKLTAENFKKLSAVEITPDGNVVIISGKNAAGKSSVLDSIEAALCGGRMPKKPIKDGEVRAKVEVNIGDYEGSPKFLGTEVNMGSYKVTRKFFGASSTLTVETTGETKTEVKKPQAFLDEVVGNLSFDPLAFLNKQPAEQRNTLMDFLGLNLDELDNKVASLKAERSDVRKEKERKLHEADSITFTPNLPEAEQGADALLAELQAIRDHNESCQMVITEKAVHQTRLEAIEKDMMDADAAIENWQKRLEKLRSLRNELKRELGEQLTVLTRNPAEVEAKIKALGDTNEAIRRNAQKKQASREYELAIETYSKLGEDIKITETNKARKMAEAVMPVEGLTIQSDGLAYGGIPLEQVNAAKQLEVCVAISMAMNPKLKVLRINGNDLDTESLSAIGKIVDNQGYQVWIEKVSDDNKIGFFIEDGHLTGDQNEKETN